MLKTILCLQVLTTTYGRQASIQSMSKRSAHRRNQYCGDLFANLTETQSLLAVVCCRLPAACCLMVAAGDAFSNCCLQHSVCCLLLACNTLADAKDIVPEAPAGRLRGCSRRLHPMFIAAFQLMGQGLAGVSGG